MTTETPQDTSTVRDMIISLLTSTERDGMRQMIDYLVDGGFFESPASTKFHGSHPGGLAEHSLGVYDGLLEWPVNILTLDQDTTAGKKPLPITPEGIVIACLLHDVNKVGAYIGTEAPYKWNKEHPEGHGELSVSVVSEYIKLTDLEAMMIRFHMGFYGLYEYYDPGSWDYKTQPEYHLRSLAPKPKKPTPEEKKADQLARYGKTWRNAVYHNPVIFWMHVADMQAMQIEKDERKVVVSSAS